MKAYSIAILLTTRVLAQTVASVPPCAQPCVAKYTSGSSIAGCNSVDVACICSNPGFISGLACCLSSVCSAADQQSAMVYANQICASNGVTNLPTSAVCTSSVSSASSIIASAAGSSVTSSGISSATTSHISTSLSSAASSVASSLSPGSSTTHLSSGASTALPSSPTPSSSPAKSFNTSSNSGLSKGAKVGIAVGAIAGFIIVLLALFLLLRKRKIQKFKGNMQSRYDMPREAELPAEKPTGTVQAKELETPANKHELESPKKEKTIQRGELATGANDRELWRTGSHSPEMFTTVIPGNELATPANTHELSPTAGKPIQRKELPTPANDHQLGVSTSPTRSPTWDREVVPDGAFGHSYPNERDPNQSPAVAEPPPKQTFSQPFESVPIDPHIPDSSRASSQTLLSGSNVAASSTARMDELRAKRDKIRLEKERLLKLQELDEMEAAVQKEMLEEARRAGGDVS